MCLKRDKFGTKNKLIRVVFVLVPTARINYTKNHKSGSKDIKKNITSQLI